VCGKVGLDSDVFREVGLGSGRVRRGRFIVGTFSAKSCYCRDVLDFFGLVSGRFRRCLLGVGTWSARSV